MQLLIDSVSPDEIRQALAWGIVEGVTTNPSLVARGGPDKIATLHRIVELSPGPVYCQVIGWQDVEPLAAQARWLHRQSDKIVVKLPMSAAGIGALRVLRAESPGIKLAVTAVASVAQAYLAARHGADVVALFNGPLDQALDQPVDLVGPVKRLCAHYGFSTRVLSCGRHPRGFGEFAAAGTDICTMRFEFLKLLFEHPYTEQRLGGFHRDWQATFGAERWPEARR
jgi:transaldolase